MILIDNPELKRLVRSKLRVRALISYGAAGLLIFGGVLAFAYFVAKENQHFSSSPFSLAKVLRDYFFVAAGIQLAMVSLFGTALASQNVTLEKERGTFDFQRLVAMGPWRLTAGKLFGAPAEALLMALVGVPFALAAGLGGGIPASGVFQAELTVFLFGIAASSFGLLCSSIVEKTAHATGLLVLAGFAIYVMMAASFNLNVNSLWDTANPVYMLKQLMESGYSLGSNTFHFCGVDVPIIFGFILLNSLFIALCTTITARRIAEVELSFMTPRQGIIAFLILQVLLIADLESRWHTAGDALQIYHAVNMPVLIALAFALTPGAELVRGRVMRGARDEQWRIVFERSNRLQDSPALRVVFEVCAIYVVVSAAYTFTFLVKIAAANAGDVVFHAALLTAMNAALGITAAALLLYIQVYTERGCFKLGMAFLFFGFILPPTAVWIANLATDAVKIENVLRVSPVAYLSGLYELQRNDSELACPLVIAATFCTLAALRIRFLLDMEELSRKRRAAAAQVAGE
ncbi:MAG TPA: ABC transporter permease [Planctomycetota bacterium]|nr:ABC transporter permease [Planctomycetota bacterium]